jgi:hypothetical protein
MRKRQVVLGMFWDPPSLWSRAQSFSNTERVLSTQCYPKGETVWRDQAVL